MFVEVVPNITEVPTMMASNITTTEAYTTVDVSTAAEAVNNATTEADTGTTASAEVTPQWIVYIRIG